MKLLYDIYHMQIMEGDVIRTIRDNQSWIAHFHTGGVPGRHELDDTQELNWRTVAQGHRRHGLHRLRGPRVRPDPRPPDLAPRGRCPLRRLARYRAGRPRRWFRSVSRYVAHELVPLRLQAHDDLRAAGVDPGIAVVVDADRQASSSPGRTLQDSPPRPPRAGRGGSSASRATRATADRGSPGPWSAAFDASAAAPAPPRGAGRASSRRGERSSGAGRRRRRAVRRRWPRRRSTRGSASRCPRSRRCSRS